VTGIINGDCFLDGIKQMAENEDEKSWSAPATII
jgi:hypothetical protein